MTTREDKVKKEVEQIYSQHGDNLANIFGTGSFFYQDLSQEYGSQTDRTIDFHLVVNDLKTFYNNHEITAEELDNFGIQSDDKNSIDKLIKNFVQANKLVPLYHMNQNENYRITVVPYHKIDEWTSDDSPIGYFLTGRWQKPMKQYLTSENPHELDEKFRRIYEKGVELTMNTSYGEYSIEDFIERIYALSYMSEGRGIGSKKKSRKIFEACKDESLDIYEPLISRSFNTETGSFTIQNSRRKAKQNEREFKKWAAPRACWVRHNLNETFPNGDDFAARKIARSIKLDDNNPFSRTLGLLLLQPLKLYQSYQLSKLPNE